jgi:microcystin-dependent protein
MKIGKLLASATLGATALLFSSPASAQVDYYMGEVITVGFTFCPTGTLEAAGQILSIAQYNAMFSLYGVQYGGNGTQTFGLPDLRGRSPIGQGQGPGLSPFVQGTPGGAESVTQTLGQMAMHTHTAIMVGTTGAPNYDNAANAALADFPDTQPIYNNTVAPSVAMAPGTVRVSPAGGNQPMPIRSPFLALRYCVVMNGIYPSRG